MKLEIEFEMTVDEIESIFNRPAQPIKRQAVTHNVWRIYERLTDRQKHVIASCERKLSLCFGSSEARRYMVHIEAQDARGRQYWLRYQMERSWYVEDYSLLAHAQAWLETHHSQNIP